jgi:5-methylcytosine-specific restriction endonuclease McrBC regulatory subunit McrC
VEILRVDDLALFLDCKYKKTPVIEEDSSNAALPLNSDVYQMLAYMMATG